MWKIEVEGYGELHEVEVEANLLATALNRGLEELGFADNDEGSLVIRISGEAGQSLLGPQPARSKKLKKR